MRHDVPPVRAPRTGSARGPAQELTGPLGHLVEQLWQPLLDTGHVRVVLGGDDDDGWMTRERYLVLPTVGRATMLLPDGPRRATTGALLNYRGLRRRLPNLQRTVLGKASGTRFGLPFPRLAVQVARNVPPEELPPLPLEMLARALGRDQLFASIGIRTGANRKATLQLVDERGEPAGFAKVAWDPASDEGVRREAWALREEIDAGPARSPRLLAEGDYHGHPYLVTAPLPLAARGVRADVPAPAPQELFTLCPITRNGPFGGTGQLRALAKRVEDLPGDRKAIAVVETAAALLAELTAADLEVPVTARWHGDLTPWNAARDRDGTLWCWDWESSEPDVVAGMDALHWHCTVLTERGHALDGDVLAHAHAAAEATLVAAGHPREARPLVTALYAVTVAERACALAAGSGGWEAGWVLPGQLLDLLATARRLMQEAR